MAARTRPFVIVGGGMAADAAARGIRAVDPERPILLFSSEPHPPYDRPPLSKGLWHGTPEERIWRDTADESVTVRVDSMVTAIDPECREIELSNGERQGYEGLVLATGCRPRRLPGDPSGVVYFRDFESYRTVRRAADEGRRIAIIGGGFIGTELGASLRDSGSSVSLHYPEGAPLERILPGPLPRRIAEAFADRGIELHPHREVSDGAPLPDADLVVAGVGVEPRVGLARDAGLEVDGGIRVDASLQCSEPGIFAAGDVVSFPLPLRGGRYLRLEHESHANESGMLAGMGVAGSPQRYDPVPTFYSGFFGVTWEVAGLLECDDEAPGLHLGASIDDPGVGIYRVGGELGGLLLWNRPGMMGRAKTLLRDAPGSTDSEILERLNG
ncbi:MAG: NAD(P)/FAD-dependent oxidoreductase [Gemmatimonadales bacterium]|nr:MAG: NAD(P)/FAD-dependent oxidoreductase [Gemmatimonadales bacterium]